MTQPRKKHRFWITVVWIANIVVAAITVSAGYGGIVDPAITAIPAILAMTFPAWLMLSVVLMVADWFICRVTAIVPLISIIATAGPLTAYSPMNFTPASETGGAGSGTFSVMSYNVLALNDIQRDSVSADPAVWMREIADGALNPTVSYILRERPDIGAFQEFPQLRPIASLHYTQPQVDSMLTLFPHHTDVHGEAICSRFRLEPVELRQPEGPYAWFCGAMADIDGHPTLLVSVHLQSIGLNDDDKELYHELTEGEGRHKIRKVKQQLLSKLSAAFKQRARQARLLREQIDSLGVENVIVAGDFNDITDCHALRELCRDDFSNAFSTAGCGPTITYHANRFYFHIDHIVYRGKMKAVGFKRGGCPHSDHYPITATFRWED